MARWGYWLAGAWALAAFIIAYIDLHDRYVVPGQENVTFLKLALYWGCWALLPLLATVVMRLVIQQQGRLRRAVAALIISVLAWGFIVEPRIITVRQHTIAAPEGTPSLRLALVSDLHVGLFMRNLDPLVDAINAQDVDVVVIAGDWTYEPRRPLCDGFGALQRLKAPIVGVLGNHDLQAPGPLLDNELKACLASRGVHLVDGTTTKIGNWEFVGLSDAWGANPTADATRLFPRDSAPRVVVFHQPDTATLVPPQSATVMVSGHTHGGQIALPYLTQWVLASMSRNAWTNGLYQTPQGPLVVSTGIGTVGPPVRFGTPPRVEVITIG